MHAGVETHFHLFGYDFLVVILLEVHLGSSHLVTFFFLDIKKKSFFFFFFPLKKDRGSPCQTPAGNRITRRPPDHRKETQTAVVWSCLPFIRFGQNHFARLSERGKKT